MPDLRRFGVEVVPEEVQVEAAIIFAPVIPGFWKHARDSAQLKRPDLTIMSGVPEPQVLADRGASNARFLAQFAKCSVRRSFA
jgi:hypothetical protein